MVRDILSKKTLLVFIAVLVLAIGLAVYFSMKFYDLKNNPQKATQEDTAKLVAKVSRLIMLPENETPTVATVTDPNLLKGQAFFANAKKGDRVLIYSGAKKAILYDPEADRLVEVAPVNLGGAIQGQ
jgi:hypothetical protein